MRVGSSSFFSTYLPTPPWSSPSRIADMSPDKITLCAWKTTRGRRQTLSMHASKSFSDSVQVRRMIFISAEYCLPSAESFRPSIFDDWNSRFRWNAGRSERSSPSLGHVTSVGTGVSLALPGGTTRVSGHVWFKSGFFLSHAYFHRPFSELHFGIQNSGVASRKKTTTTVVTEPEFKWAGKLLIERTLSY